MEQVLPRQRAEGDDPTGRVENVSNTIILFIWGGGYTLQAFWRRHEVEPFFSFVLFA